jgi:cation diffusion facilitator family transporter
VTTVGVATERRDQLQRALRLGWFTVAWNVTEGVVALVAATAAGSRALLGFGFDSGVESLSAAVLIWRLQVERREPKRAERVEQRAVKLIGVTFLVLGAFVAFEAIRSLATRAEPEASTVGVVLTLVSLIVMPVLAARKRQVATAMGSRAVEADSAQTMACAYLSVVVLVGLVLNAALEWWWADPVAALVVVVLLVREGWAALHAEHVDDCCR